MSLKDFNFDFNEDIIDDGLIQTEKFVPNKSIERKIGGFENMTDEEIEEFKNSKEYKEYGVDVNEEVITDTKANMHGKSVQEVLGLTKKHESLAYSYNAIQCYDIDIEIYEDIVAQSPVMQETLEEGESLLPTFKYLHQDIYLSLFINEL